MLQQSMPNLILFLICLTWHTLTSTQLITSTSTSFPKQCFFPPLSVNTAAKSLQSCPTLCDPIDGTPPGSTVPGILQARYTGVGCHFLLQCIKVKSESEVAQSYQTRATPWTAAYQAPPSMGFSRQKYWSGVPLPSPDLSIQ